MVSLQKKKNLAHFLHLVVRWNFSKTGAIIVLLYYFSRPPACYCRVFSNDVRRFVSARNEPKSMYSVVAEAPPEDRKKDKAVPEPRVTHNRVLMIIGLPARTENVVDISVPRLWREKRNGRIPYPKRFRSDQHRNRRKKNIRRVELSG